MCPSSVRAWLRTPRRRSALEAIRAVCTYLLVAQSRGTSLAREGQLSEANQICTAWRLMQFAPNGFDCHHQEYKIAEDRSLALEIVALGSGGATRTPDPRIMIPVLGR